MFRIRLILEDQNSTLSTATPRHVYMLPGYWDRLNSIEAAAKMFKLIHV